MCAALPPCQLHLCGVVISTRLTLSSYLHEVFTSLYKCILVNLIVQNCHEYAIVYSKTFPSEVKGTWVIWNGVERWRSIEKHLEAAGQCSAFSDLLHTYIRHVQCEFRIFCYGASEQIAVCCKQMEKWLLRHSGAAVAGRQQMSAVWRR
jgi:hypothetical protein